MFTTQIDTGYLLGLIVCGVLLLAWVAVGFGVKWLCTTDDDDFSGTVFRRHPAATGFWTAAALWLVTIGGFVVLAWPPLPGQYNEYRPFSGTVAQTGSRFIASGVKNGGTSQRFMVQFSDGTVVGCDDTRCSALRKGQPVTLLCERDWQWNATEGWVCNFGSYTLNRPAGAP